MLSMSRKGMRKMSRGDTSRNRTPEDGERYRLRSLCVVEELQRFTTCGWSIIPANKIYQSSRVVRYGI